MDSAAFKRNVMRTVGVKSAKHGLRTTARDTVDTNVLHGVFGLNTEMGGLLQNLRPYILGFPLNQSMLQDSFTSFGGVSYYLVMLAKSLKVKVPGSGSKHHLKGMTIGEGLMQLNSLSGDLLYYGMGTFHGGLGERQTAADLVSQFIEIFWPLTYELLGVPMGVVFEDYITKIAPGYPENLFSANNEQAAAAVKKARADETADIAKQIEDRAAVKAEKKAHKVAADAGAEDVQGHDAGAAEAA